MLLSSRRYCTNWWRNLHLSTTANPPVPVSGCLLWSHLCQCLCWPLLKFRVNRKIQSCKRITKTVSAINWHPFMLCAYSGEPRWVSGSTVAEISCECNTIMDDKVWTDHEKCICHLLPFHDPLFRTTFSTDPLSKAELTVADYFRIKAIDLNRKLHSLLNNYHSLTFQHHLSSPFKFSLKFQIQAYSSIFKFQTFSIFLKSSTY